MAESASARDKKKKRIQNATAALRKQIFGASITEAEKAAIEHKTPEKGEKKNRTRP
jgi:hypothetical protein